MQYTILLYMQESRIHFSYIITSVCFLKLDLSRFLHKQQRSSSSSPHARNFEKTTKFLTLRCLCCYYRRSSWISNKWKEVATFSKEPTLFCMRIYVGTTAVNATTLLLNFYYA